MTKPDDALAALRSFRAELYACGRARRDAQFEVVAALALVGVAVGMATRESPAAPTRA